ncbi:MAG: DNA polymerase III subunit gamma/tau [Dehalococcoidia bacterium]|nr:DNA polymerase III subunit gamma/tau [Dehalococcoidia bacterium]
MTSQVFYRKWRPQMLGEVAGQEHVTTTLANALSVGRVAHAYLFCGPRGTGKTSTGRILAKAVNCLQGGKGEPCNTCVMCQSFNEGRALDLIEIDAASNRGIEEIRALKEKVNFAPISARMKVYIIDEVHMLTEPAFNALLKTLEEPPAHSIFILATTEVHKIPATILSRCQRFDFKRIPLAAVIGRLRYVCQKEGIEVSDDALSLIARSATGSLRDAENLLEQIATSRGASIDLAQVREVLGITGDARVRKLAQQVLDKDLSGGLASINSASEDGLDLNQFNREMIDFLRGVLLVKSGAGATLDITAEGLAEMKALAARSSLPGIVQAIKLFGQASFRSDSYSTLPLELALADCVLAGSAGEARVAEAKAVEFRVGEVKTGALVRPEVKPAPSREAAAPFEGRTQPVAKPPPPPVARPAPHEQPGVVNPAAPVAAGGEQFHAVSPSADVATLNVELKKRLREPPEHIRRTPAVALLRSSCRIAAIEQDSVVLEFKHKIHKEKVEASVRPEVKPAPHREAAVPFEGRTQSVAKPPPPPVARPAAPHEQPGAVKQATPVATGGEQLHPISPAADVAMLNAEWKKRLKEPPEHIRRTPAVALLRSACRIAGIEQDNVVLEFKHKIHKEKVEEAVNRRVTEEILSAMLGAPHRVRCVLAGDLSAQVQERPENYLVKEAMKFGGRIVTEEKNV